MYIFFFIFALLILAVWNSGYLGMFSVTKAQPLDNTNSSDPVPNRQRRNIKRSRVRRREIDSKNVYACAGSKYVLTVKGGDSDTRALRVTSKPLIRREYGRRTDTYKRINDSVMQLTHSHNEKPVISTVFVSPQYLWVPNQNPQISLPF